MIGMGLQSRGWWRLSSRGVLFRKIQDSRISLRGRTASLCVVKDAVLAHLTFSLLPPSGFGSLCLQPFFQMVITMAQPQPLLRVLRWSLKFSQTHYLLLCSKENCCCCLISFKWQKRICRRKIPFYIILVLKSENKGFFIGFIPQR